MYIYVYVCKYTCVCVCVCMISLVISGGGTKDFQKLSMAIIFHNQPRNTFALKNSIGRKKEREKQRKRKQL